MTVAKPVRLLFTYADTGFARRYYKDIDKKGRGSSLMYCMMDNSVGETVMWACSKDGEPAHSVSNFEIVLN